MKIIKKVFNKIKSCNFIKQNKISLEQEKLRKIARNSSNVSIYILYCEEGKYYVGKTKNATSLKKRLENHFNVKGSSWTQKYKPLYLFDNIDNCDDYDEDKYTLKYMNLFGIDNVRGGSYCQLTLSENMLKEIKEKIYGSEDRCFCCGSKEHFINLCPKKIIKSNKI